MKYLRFFLYFFESQGSHCDTLFVSLSARPSRLATISCRVISSISLLPCDFRAVDVQAGRSNYFLDTILLNITADLGRIAGGQNKLIILPLFKGTFFQFQGPKHSEDLLEWQVCILWKARIQKRTFKGATSPPRIYWRLAPDFEILKPCNGWMS